MAVPARRPGCGRLLVRGLLILLALALGVLAWDVWQLRALQPPENRTFQGFVMDGRPGSLRIDRDRGRLYWIAPRARTVVRFPEPPAYEFDRSGRLVNWTPGTPKGMLHDDPVHVRGDAVTVAEAAGWIQPGGKF